MDVGSWLKVVVPCLSFAQQMHQRVEDEDERCVLR